VGQKNNEINRKVKNALHGMWKPRQKALILSLFYGKMVACQSMNGRERKV
jgi:hypothetical protein